MKWHDGLLVFLMLAVLLKAASNTSINIEEGDCFCWEFYYNLNDARLRPIYTTCDSSAIEKSKGKITSKKIKTPCVEASEEGIKIKYFK
jgi:hypothetical protein